MEPSLSPLGHRRPVRWVAAVAVAAVGLAPAVVTWSRSEAAPAGEATLATTTTLAAEGSVGAATDTTTDPAVAEVTPTTTPVSTTTTGAATAPTVPPTTSTTTPRGAAAVAPTRLQQVEAIADGTGFDWRGTGLSIHIAYHPEDCCHWGVYDFRDNSLWIGPTAFANTARLRYVVLHELAHAWQDTQPLDRLIADMTPWGYSGYDALEPSADCVATLWGATTDHYWTCPPDAEALAARRLAGDWS